MSTCPPGGWTYDSIVRGLCDRRILLRVHTLPSSPLLGSHNDAGSAGFTARNLAFRGLTADQYAEATAGLRYDRGWAEGPYMRQTIIDHINDTSAARQQNRLTTQKRRVQVQPDDLSPWISTTASMYWAIWYIAKLLSRPDVKRVRLAVIDRTSSNSTRPEALFVDPFHRRHMLEGRAMPLGRERDQYYLARRRAAQAREMLYYGRIFGESILSDLVFTPHVVPFALPAKYWNPAHQCDRSRPGWLARLRWHPAILNFEMTLDLIERPVSLGKYGYRQPVGSANQFHAVICSPAARVAQRDTKPKGQSNDKDKVGVEAIL